MNKKCQRCGSKKGRLIINSRRGNSISWMCRKCNTKRLRKYRATPKGKLATRQAVYRSIKKLWYKQKARLKLNMAINKGLIVRPKTCSNCLKRKKIEAHHPNYSLPYAVIWLCRSCHADL